LNRRNINLNALRAFEAAARHLNFSRAAEELLVTHAAISHQLKQLEEQLGVRLFTRTPRGVTLTEAGAALKPELSASFDRISKSLDGIARQASPSVISVTTTPSFASRWLVPRLPSWRKASGGRIDVNLIPTLQMLDLTRGEADIAIRCGIPPWTGLKADHLLPVHMTPVCSPQLPGFVAGFDKPRDLLESTLLHADVGENPMGTEWQTWLNEAGVRTDRRLPGLSFRDPALSMEAAISGVGVAIGYVELVRTDLAFGRLAQPFELAVEHPFSYYLVYPAQHKSDPMIGAFRNWIMSDMLDDAA
jgi:LysR family glycine cleavage system transcriptional activator